MNPSLNSAPRPRIWEDLLEKGWSVQPDFYPAHLCKNLRMEILDLWKNQEKFRPAGTGKGIFHSYRPEIRSDLIFWLDPETLSPLLKPLWELFLDLQQTLNLELFLGLQAFEAHYAVYPQGSFYRKHIDQFKTPAWALRGQSHRQISCALYLNEEWRPQWGGQLRIYDQNRPEKIEMDIFPLGGTLIVFLSSSIYHEVLPTHKERYSLTGWMGKALH